MKCTARSISAAWWGASLSKPTSSRDDPTYTSPVIASSITAAIRAG